MKDLINIMRKLNENKNGRVVTFDFDNTIVKSFENKNDGREIEYQFGGINPQIIARIKKFKEEGATVFVVTARNVALERNETSVKTMLDQLNIKVDGIFYTNGDPKAKKLYELGSSLHYDDSLKEKEAIEAYTQLHQDFNIKVINGDDLLSDIEEIAKGLIMTTDGKIIIVQRSDTLEWDAAGGHLMEGEEPAFAFWREIKEELQLDVTNVQLIDSLETRWKKKDQLVHYYFSTVPYSSDELSGAIELQWELADYFVGDIQEIDEKMATPDGATHNLRNTINLILENHDFLMEGYQQTSSRLRRYASDAHELLGTGPQTKGWGTGIKNVKAKKGKSAPPGAPGGGWGPVEEDKDPPKRSKLKIRFVYNLKEKKRIRKKRKNRGNLWPYGSNDVIGNDGGADGGDG